MRRFGRLDIAVIQLLVLSRSAISIISVLFLLLSLLLFEFLASLGATNMAAPATGLGW